MKLGLRARISSVGIVAVIAFLVAVFFHLKSTWDENEDAQHVQVSASVLVLASELVSEIQKERGLSSSYLGGGATMSAVENQRQRSDAKVPAFLARLEENYYSDSNTIPHLKNALAKLPNLRGQIANQDSAAITGYSNLVKTMLTLYISSADSTNIGKFKVEFNSIAILEEAKEYGGRLRAQLTGILNANLPLETKQFKSILNADGKLHSNLSTPGLVISEESQRRIAGFKTSPHWKEVSQIVQKVARTASNGNYGFDGKEFFATATLVVDDVGSVIQGELAALTTFAKEEESKASTALLWMIVSILLVTLGLGAVLWFVTQAIAGPINQVISNLTGSATRVSSASKELQSSSDQLSSGASEAASSVEETTSSLEELSGMVRNNSDNAKEANALSQKSHESAGQGEKEIQHLIGAMSEISESSKKIEEIINVIDEIAFQTNLLALNAAVEAARAGEQGKGFAVVAEAVRNLAGRSASAAKDITSLIKESVEKIERGVKIADSSGEVLKNIVVSVKKVADLNHDIASASEEQATEITQISRAMNQLDQATQQNAASAEQTAASSQEMSGQSHVLQDLVTNLQSVVEGSAGKLGSDHSPQSPSPLRTPSPSAGTVVQMPQQRTAPSPTKAQEMIPFDDDELPSNGKQKVNDLANF